MVDLVVSINDNELRISYLDKGNFKSVIESIPSEMVKDSIINDVAGFSGLLGATVSKLMEGKTKNIRLSFIVEPDDLVFKFITLAKSNGDVQEVLAKEISKRVTEMVTDDMYYSTIKIAPFVYQFVGVKKQTLDKYLEISNSTGFELHSVMPWALLLPKYVGTNISAIYLCKTGKTPVVMLSELGGVFFVGNYNENKSPEELAKLIQELSVYKRVKPIDKVYTFNYDDLKDDIGFSPNKVELPHSGEENTVGFENNLLGHYMLDLVPDVVTSQTNLLNLLPLPAVKTNRASLVPVGAALSAILIAGLIFGGFTYFTKHKNAAVVTGGEEQVQVLSESSTSVDIQSTVATENGDSSDGNVEDKASTELQKDVLVIDVQNGSGYNGIAAKTRDLLETVGYRVLAIGTADFQQEATTLQFKKDMYQYKDLLETDMKDNYPNLLSTDDLPDSSEYDVVIIVGTSVEL